METIQILKNELGTNVLTTEESVTKFSVGGRVPSAVVFPENQTQICLAIKLAQKFKKKILIFGSNTQQDFGSAPEPFDWAISLKNMNHVVSYDAADLTVTAEAGITLGELQKHLRSHHQYLPLDPPGGNHRTIGGIVATNSTGSLIFSKGTCRDLILGMKIVLPEGKIIKTGGKTVKNVAGYNLSRLFTGSMGTLGAIYEVTFKLSPALSDSQSLLLCTDHLPNLASFTKSVLSSQLVLSRLDYFNHSFFNKAFNQKNIPQRAHYVIINIMGHPDMTTDGLNRLVQLSKDHHLEERLVLNHSEESEYWNKLCENDYFVSLPQGSVSIQISVPKVSLWTLLDIQQNDLNKQAAFHALAGNGILNIYFHNLNHGVSKLESIIEHYRSIVRNLGGNLIINHAPLEIRKSDIIWGNAEIIQPLLRQIKKEYDPEKVIAAGRFIGEI